jgi:hypothetical protein
MLWVHTKNNRAFVQARDVSEILIERTRGSEPGWGVWIVTTTGNRHLVLTDELEDQADECAQDLMLKLATDAEQGLIAWNGTTFEVCPLGPTVPLDERR